VALKYLCHSTPTKDWEERSKVSAEQSVRCGGNAANELPWEMVQEILTTLKELYRIDRRFACGPKLQPFQG
jgi:hypothetical protein